MLYLISNIAYWIVILLHLYFALLEMALWKTRGPKIFGMTQEFANQSAALASNQGLYNVFLATALLIGYFATNIDVAVPFMFYGLSCVIIAGIWGAVTVNKRIFFVQALPAIIALALRLINASL